MKIMKKFSALILLAAVSLAISAVLLFVNCITLLSISVTTVTLAVFISMAVAFGTAGLYKKLRTKLEINALLFWIFAYAPELVIGVGTLLWAYYQSARYLFLGLSGLLLFYTIPITGVAYAVCGALFTITAWCKLKETQQ